MTFHLVRRFWARRVNGFVGKDPNYDVATGATDSAACGTSRQMIRPRCRRAPLQTPEPHKTDEGVSVCAARHVPAQGH